MFLKGTMVNLIFFIIGLCLLVKGADFLITGAQSFARNFRISDIIISLTLVAFGTSLAELFVNVFASLAGDSDIVLGNILGSNIVNVLLILGLSAVIYPLKVTDNTILKEIPLSLLASILVFGLLFDSSNVQINLREMSRLDGVVLLGFFVLFLYYIYSISVQSLSPEVATQPASLSVKKSIIFALFGLVGLAFGARLVVKSAVELAFHFGVSEALVSLTIVSIGTSLPEMATSLRAAFRKNSDIAVGNIVGSNIFNIFFILGVSAVIRPVNYNVAFDKDVYMGIIINILMFVFMFTGTKKVFDRFEGIAFVFIYILYIIVVIRMG